MLKWGMFKIEYKQFIGPAIVTAIIVALYYLAFEWMVNTWWYSEYYSHSFLILPVAAIIIWTRRTELKTKEPYQHGIWIFLAGLILYVIGFMRESNFLVATSLLLVLPGLALFARGPKVLRAIAFPIFLLVFMIPLPWLDEISRNLQSFAARTSAWIVDLMGVSITRTGSQIELENVAFEIGLPCSGMHSLIALLALSAIFAYILNGSFKRKLALVVLAVPIAIFSNIFRIVVLLLVGNKWGEDAVIGIIHDPLSPIVFVVAIVCLVITAKLLRFNLRETASQK